MSSLGAKLSLPPALALALWMQSAAGQTQDPDRIACADPSPQTRIQACSALLKTARASDLDTPVAYNNRGLAYSETGQHELAIQDFNQAISIFPSYAIAYSNRGLARENIGQMKEAIADFDQALKLNPDYAAAYNNRCYVKAVLGDLSAALADCQKAVSLLPEDAKTLDSLA
jgi:tetratricopeptide (TPR) repeat protein